MIGSLRQQWPDSPIVETTVDHDTVRSANALSWVFSALAVTTCSTLLSLSTPALWHWMTLVTSIAGVLLGVDVVDWVRARLDILQPRAVVALFGFHLCYLGPLLHVVWDHWPRYVTPAEDWRASLGVLGLVNVAGIVLYKLVLSVQGRSPSQSASRLDLPRFATAGAVMVSVGLLALIAVVLKFGGPSGYLRVISGTRQALAGNGWLLLLAESWPLPLLAIVLVYRRAWFRSHLLPLLLLLVVFVLVQFVIGGLRGSRGNTVWPTVMAVGLVHLIVRPVGRSVIVVTAALIVGFMYLYGFYKSVGADVLDLASPRTTTTTLAHETGRTLPLLLLEDFGRAGTQSLLVDRLAGGGNISWGLTYVGDVVKLVPDSIIPNPSIDKSFAGTDLLYAPGAYEAGRRSSRIFGLSGEGMLNFGLIGGALAFLPFAAFVRWADRVWQTAIRTDSLPHRLVGPGLTAIAVMALGSDLDNVLRLSLAQVLPLVIVVYLARRSDRQDVPALTVPASP